MLKDNLIIAIIGIIFFGGLTVLNIIKYFNPKFKYISDSVLLGKDKLKYHNDFKSVYDDLGIFKFDTEGFSYTINDNIKNHKWTQIKTLIGYKVDNFTTDTICLDIFLEDLENSFTINEETPGWFQFNIKLTEHFKTINPNWQIEISTPAFDPKPNVLYDFMNRPLNEVETEYYRRKIK